MSYSLCYEPDVVIPDIWRPEKEHLKTVISITSSAFPQVTHEKILSALETPYEDLEQLIGPGEKPVKMTLDMSSNFTQIKLKEYRHAKIKAELVEINTEEPLPRSTPQLASNQEKTIPLHGLLKNGSIVLAIVCVLSLVTWIVDVQSLMILNPFAASLALFLCPFLYAMGWATRLPKKN